MAHPPGEIDGVLPLRLGSTALWSSVTHQSADHSHRVLDFVETVRRQVPYLIGYRHHVKVCLAFRAKVHALRHYAGWRALYKCKLL
uniref:TERF1-interacting nuclear factor 2 N-terminal domain-containing protein n=1 Tax=Callorhinchus milii TaxID=7868 RepID=A0A4W3JFW4_CALMI